MALARVVSFDGVSSDRMAEMKSQIESGEPPEGMPAGELLILHDPEGTARRNHNTGLAIVGEPGSGKSNP